MKRIIPLLAVLFLLSCSSKKSDKELMDEANLNLDQDKIPEAVMALEELIDTHMDSELAPEALSKLGSVYQNRLLKNIPDKESLEKAANLFRKIYDDYPESSYAPTGLFMAGFVLANELKYYDRATETYNLFIEKFPNHQLVASAKEEVENMGLSPEEILQKNLAKQK
jgi:TolA-binding protein